MNISINFNPRALFGTVVLLSGLALTAVAWTAHTEIEEVRENWNALVEISSKNVDDLPMNQKMALAAVNFNEVMNPGSTVEAKKEIERRVSHVNMLFSGAALLNLLGIWLLRAKRKSKAEVPA